MESAPRDPATRIAWREYWTIRQAALEIDTHGDWLQPGDIQALELFQAVDPALPLRCKIEWIPRSSTGVATNDFVWKTNENRLVEMKFTRGKYSSIHDLVARSVNEMSKKSIFMIVIRRGTLSKKLRWQLGQYNIRNHNRRIAEMWVVVNGNLEQVILE